MKQEVSMGIMERLSGLNRFLFRGRIRSVCCEELVSRALRSQPGLGRPVPRLGLRAWPSLRYRRKIISILPFLQARLGERRPCSRARKYQTAAEAQASPEENNCGVWRVDFGEALDLWDGGEVLGIRTCLEQKYHQLLLFQGETFQNNFSFHILHNI